MSDQLPRESSAEHLRALVDAATAARQKSWVDVDTTRTFVTALDAARASLDAEPGCGFVALGRRCLRPVGHGGEHALDTPDPITHRRRNADAVPGNRPEDRVYRRLLHVQIDLQEAGDEQGEDYLLDILDQLERER